MAQSRRSRPFLVGVAAGVIGLIAAAAIDLAEAGVVDVPTAILAIAAFAALYRWQAKLTVVWVVAGCGLVGWALQASGIV